MKLAQLTVLSYAQNVRSKTVSLKIRYGDFTTVSVQETFKNYISNADDLYEKSVYLLKKKYKNDNGIRLIGISCDKLEDRDLPVQKDMFDYAGEKKAKLEKAIFEMQQKKPSLKLTKARLIEEEQNNRFHRDRNG